MEGQVQAIEASGKTLTVLGQTILVTDSTIIDDSVPGRDLTRLVPNVDVVEVSGFVFGDGVLIATLIDRKAGAPDFELKGLVKNHDTGTKTFQLVVLTVSYDGADISGMPNPTGNAWNGLPVHLLGSQFSLITPGELTTPASDLCGTGFVRGSRRHTCGNEGFVSQIVPPNGFLVGHIMVQFDSQTLFVGGTATDLGPGVRVEVKGDVSGNILFANRIELDSHVKIEADLATANTVDGVSGSLTFTGLTGTVVHINAQTQFKGQGAPLRMGDLSAGDHLTVRGEPFGDQVIATEITRQPGSNNAVLQGPVSSTSPPSIVILMDGGRYRPTARHGFQKGGRFSHWAHCILCSSTAGGDRGSGGHAVGGSICMARNRATTVTFIVNTRTTGA